MSPLSYRLVRSERKSVALVVGRDATLTVRAPIRFPIDRIESFIEEKLAWVERAIERIHIRAKEEKKRQYEDDERFWYLGEQYPLRISCQSRQALVFLNGEFVMAKQFHVHAREAFAWWYRREANKIFPERVVFFAQKFGITYQSVKVNAAKTRWGSCSANGNLNFSFRLVMAPLSVIDSVVVHELAHLAHRNHSASFWSAVAAMYPDFKSAREWLKRNGHLLEC